MGILPVPAFRAQPFRVFSVSINRELPYSVCSILIRPIRCGPDGVVFPLTITLSLESGLEI
jgi:hypothetical protein